MLISPLFSADETQAILDAAQEWRAATHGVASLRLAIGNSDGEHMIVPGPELHSLGLTQRPGGVLGGPVRIFINTQRIERLAPIAAGVKQVAMHELLHGFGDPNHESTGLMRGSSYPGDGPCIDALALARSCALLGCPQGKDPTCPD